MDHFALIRELTFADRIDRDIEYATLEHFLTVQNFWQLAHSSFPNSRSKAATRRLDKAIRRRRSNLRVVFPRARSVALQHSSHLSRLFRVQNDLRLRAVVRVSRCAGCRSQSAPARRHTGT